MKYCLASFCLLGTLLCALAQQSVSFSEFQLKGDFLIGGLFDVHHVRVPVLQERPVAIDCARAYFILSNYRRFQLMRFSVEEINNSTNLLPNVSLGYEIFNHCSDAQNFPGIFHLISDNEVMQPWGEPNNNLSKVSKVVAVLGTFSSTQTLTVAPLFMVDLVPLVSYGSASSLLSEKNKYPSFLRTVPPNKATLKVIVSILLHFKWHWVAFIYNDNDYGEDALAVFIRTIEDTAICLGYSQGVSVSTDFSQLFGQIQAQRTQAIVVFVSETTAETIIESAIQLKITNKVWIAGDAWSSNKIIPKKKGIENIGNILGVAVPEVTLPGFNDFIYDSTSQTRCQQRKQQMFCNQMCNCSHVRAEDVIAADPSYSFSVYSAVYAVAHALHSVLHCDAGRCSDNITVYPHMVLPELKKSNFTLLNQSIAFDENGDPVYGSYSIVFWNHSGEAEEIGFYKFHPHTHFFINNTKLYEYMEGEVPSSLCSMECSEGYIKKQNSVHKCCFTCEICLNGTYVNSTEDPYTCADCKDTEWSEEGSTSCKLRTVEYVTFTDSVAILITVAACLLVGLTIAMSILFAFNYNTPVVRSAGGPMCFLILGCLSLCSISVFFYFGKPTVSFCIIRYLPFLLFYTVCLACFVVRSFQIVCIFKIGAKFPKLQSGWVKFHGQWLVITVAFVTQSVLLTFSYSFGTVKPYNETQWYPDKIILDCHYSLDAFSSSVLLLVLSCFLCFIFSYMGKDLPKNYNEAKAITFCLLLLILTWIVFATVYVLYRGKYIPTLNALAVLSSLYSFLLWYFLPKCYIIIFEPHKNTQQFFQGLIQNYTKTISQ